MERIEKVKFKDGSFGVRKTIKTWFGVTYTFKDLRPERANNFWWDNDSVWYRDCRQEEEVVDKYLRQITDIGEVVK